jgi:hypothetical protein
VSVIVLISCDRDVGEGTCPAQAYGRVGEDIDRTAARAARAGWVQHAGGHLCPLHASGRPGGTGPL